MSSSAAESSARRCALVLLAAATVLLVAAAWLRRPGASVTTGFLAPDDPLVALDGEIASEFGLTRPLVFVVVARDGNAWTRPVLEKVVALTRDVLALPGVLPTDVVSLASPNMRDLRVSEGALEPVYLMAEVPEGEEEIAALRRRVDTDPNYGGQLVSLDGEAALVVANFLPDVPDETIAAAALELRAKHDDEVASVLVTGAPILGAMVRGAAPRVLLPFVAALLLGVAVLVLRAGARDAVAAACAVVLAVVWSAALLVALHAVTLPWSAYGLAAGALLAMLCSAARLEPRRALAVAVPAVAASLTFALLLPAPASALGIGLAVGAGCGVVAGALCALTILPAAEPEGTPAERPGWLRLACLGAIALAALGMLGLRGSFGMAGYGERLLPFEARGGLDAIRRHFPPPSIFIVRLSGPPGFVSDPAVLSAMEAVAVEMRQVPGVRSVQSLADIVRLVHRAFSDEPTEELPADRGLIARYLALAYSPGFRRFVDRALSRTALWVYAEGDDPATLERVHSRLRAALDRQALPDVEVDPIAGDGALALAMASVGEKIAVGIVLALVVLTLGAALGGRGRRLPRALDVVAGGLAALLVGAGLAGWLGHAIDLVVLSVLACVAVVGGTASLLERDRLAALGAALAVAALLLALTSFGAARVLVPLLAAPLAAHAALLAVRVAREPRADAAPARRAAAVKP